MLVWREFSKTAFYRHGPNKWCVKGYKDYRILYLFGILPLFVKVNFRKR